MPFSRITVIGAGSWGTALSLLLASKEGVEVRLFGRSQTDIETMEKHRENRHYLPGFLFPSTLMPSHDFEDCVAWAELIVLAVPSSGFREALKAIHRLQKNPSLVFVSKGFELHSNKLLHQVAQEELSSKANIAALSGPSFAKEVAQQLPTAVVVASHQEVFARKVMELFATPYFRPYYSADIVGVEIGGATKNVIAIAAGISAGLGFGANALSALVTRGLHEIRSLGECLGAKSETFMGLSGLGDLVLTCTDNQSRNRRFGMALGLGKTIQEAEANIGQVVEGQKNARQAHALALQYGLDLPLIAHINALLEGEMSPREAVESLWARPLKKE
jgi:glycerol-3-phosphate dehydrogenase (NAD(P)+)